MVLEDFFTLAEMKDGLAATDRVRELMAAIQKEKNSAVKNAGDTTRQRSIVASVLAATVNMPILNHFIELGGLHFLDEWLQEAQQYSDNTSEKSVEEYTCELLSALEKLPVDKGAPAFSGIMLCVKNLAGHKCSSVQERAKVLFNQVNQEQEKGCDQPKDLGHQDEVKSLNETGTVVSSSVGQTDVKHAPVEAGADEDRSVNVLPECKLQHKSSDCSQLESVTTGDKPVSKKNSYHTTVSQVKESDVPQTGDQSSSIVLPSSQGSPTIPESSVCGAEGTGAIGVRSSLSTNNNGRTSIEEVSVLTKFPNEELGTESEENIPEKFAGKEVSYISSPSGVDHVSSADTHAQQSVMEPVVMNDDDDKALPTNAGNNTSTEVSHPIDLGVGSGQPKLSSSKMNCMATEQNDGISSNVSQDLSVTACISTKTDSIKSRFTGEAEDVKEFAADSIMKVGASDDSATTGAISEPSADVKAPDVIVRPRENSDLDFVLDDALEVARQVAKEVEREVVDYRERLCSSFSKQNSEGRVMQPGSPDSVNGEQDQLMTEPENEVSVQQSFAGGILPTNGDEHITNAKSKGKLEDRMDNHGMSQVTEPAQRPANEKRETGFDLNEGSYFQDMDHPGVVVSSSITAVSTLKEAEHELLFGSTCRAKGKQICSESAATSAFCPASVFRIPDADKAFSVEGSSSSKQRHDFLDIDLNVAEGNTIGATDAVLGKMPVSSGLPSGESSVEVSSKRPMWLMWDLNSTVDNDGRSPSPTSSSPLKQPIVRDLNLNDHPSLFESQGHPFVCGTSSVQDQGHPFVCGASSVQGRDDFEGFHEEAPYIKFMGAKLPINSRDDVIPQTRSLLPNVPFPVSQFSAYYAQPGGGAGVQYPTAQYAIAHAPPAPSFVYNGMRMMEQPYMSLSPAMYGSGAVPYTMDPRENQMGHQLMNPPMAGPPSYARPYPMNMATAPIAYNWIGPSQPNLELGSGIFMGDIGNREGTSRQASMPGTMNLMGEQMASSSRPMSPGLRKRKEPDNGYEPCLGLYSRHQQPPWH